MLYLLSEAIRWVKFETVLKYHSRYLHVRHVSRTNPAFICLYYYPQRFVILTCRYFKSSWKTTALSQSNSKNFSCSSINIETSHQMLTYIQTFLPGPLISSSQPLPSWSLEGLWNISIFYFYQHTSSKTMCSKWLDYG